ncbi:MULTISPECIES: DUF5059 domain-containing protein [Halorubrum]|uniref:Blue copper domain protein n=1 Tax=Halorubrum hochstenium ATCC 700873 TaxID=1227481 RepID=M0FNC2_9EURY|nr:MULTISPECIES: DUF5059 domain-containing protein [Halorubrum]ELZ61455.1 blue copper domain protein [Halorubrum hochstenium ATCC 700873]
MTSAAAIAAGTAGCNSRSGGNGERAAESPESEGESVHAAVAAEWNAMRARLWDALALGVADEPATGAAVAGDVFARFEEASGEYGAHETLEATSESNYAEFEEALGELRTAGLEAGDTERAREEAGIADAQLAEAQEAVAGEATSQAFELQLLGVTVRNAAFLAASGSFEAARAAAENALARFEDAAVHDAFESADAESYEAFESGVDSVASAAESEDADAVRTASAEAFQAAIDGSYAVADAEAVAGAGHVAALQARGWDAAALSSLGGPSSDFAHAAGLTVYRDRVYDARRLAANGEPERAASAVSDVFAHFEGARAHEALESADREAYEGFEAGLSDLQSAIEAEDESGVDEGVAAVDSNLVAGIEALAGAGAPLLEAAFFRARFDDARERYRRGRSDEAASVAEGLFGRFEENELDLHETVEETDEDLYETFEEEHLAGLIDAFESANDAAVETHYDGVRSTLLEFETAAGTTAAVSGAEATYVAARGFDAAVLNALGDSDRAAAVARAAFEHFEAGAGGYHEALEAADEALYETFEDRLGSVATAATDGGDVSAAAKRFGDAALSSAYAVVENGGGSHGDAAAATAEDAFAHFEEARVHELLEEADRNAYHAFEERLDAYATALREGGDAGGAAASFADAAQYAQFALVDAVEDLPLDLDLAGAGGGGSESGGPGESGDETDLSGGPNVVDGVPDDADHVVDMEAVAYAPAELTVSQGDTVAWRHAAGEPHSVTAYEHSIPEGASYWASGDFDSEEAARTGWENGEGAVRSGQSYVRTFETAGTHEYVCIPHEAAGMVGEVVVE